MVATVRLPENATYSHRHVTFIRASAAGEPVVGVIEIREARSEEGKAKCSRYAVREDGERYKLTKPGGEERYFVCLRGRYDECDCTGFLSHGACKHTLAMRELFEAGHLDSIPVG